MTPTPSGKYSAEHRKFAGKIECFYIQCVREVTVHQAAVYRDRLRTFNELKTAITAYVRNIKQADMQKAFANRINP